MNEVEIKERFLLMRQLKTSSRNGYEDNVLFTSGDVPGRVLDLILAEISLHFPSLVIEEPRQATNLVESICKRLARGEDFNFDKSLEADKRWKRGMYAEKKSNG